MADGAEAHDQSGQAMLQQVVTEEQQYPRREEEKQQKEEQKQNEEQNEDEEGEHQREDQMVKKKNKKISSLPSRLLFVNLFLSSWGDRMWQFSVGLFLVKIYYDELMLTAIFGFSSGMCILVLGGIIGQWVDNNARLKVVRWSLTLQNTCVAGSAMCVFLCLSLDETNKSEHYQIYRNVYITVMILLSVMGQLTSMAYKISIEKDWIVVIADSHASTLANLNAITRVIDLSCKMLSPIVAGVIMSFWSIKMSALFVAGWNIASLIVEYLLLSNVYSLVPELAVKENEAIESGFLLNCEEKVNLENKKKKSKLGQPFLVFYNGWKTYYGQQSLWAGVALSLLYMTVLGFDTITVGYVYASKVSPLYSSLAMSLAGCAGLLGTLSFTTARRRIGLERTGLFAFNFELICLVLCVFSIWSPGSLFQPFSIFGIFNCNSTIAGDLESAVHNGSMTLLNTTIGNINSSSLTLEHLTSDAVSTSVMTFNQMFSYPNISILLFLTGIITSRIGLWMADLVVTQIQQETVKKQERGVVNGVQNSLNMFLDLIKFALVIIVPRVESFGYLILLSFSFICLASFCFAMYSRSVRGHLFHFYNVFKHTPIVLNIKSGKDINENKNQINSNV